MSSITVNIAETIGETVSNVVAWFFYANRNEDNSKYGGEITIQPLKKTIVLLNQSSSEDEKFNDFEVIDIGECMETSNTIVSSQTVTLPQTSFTSGEKQLFATMVAME